MNHDATQATEFGVAFVFPLAGHDPNPVGVYSSLPWCEEERCANIYTNSLLNAAPVLLLQLLIYKLFISRNIAVSLRHGEGQSSTASRFSFVSSFPLTIINQTTSWALGCEP